MPSSLLFSTRRLLHIAAQPQPQLSARVRIPSSAASPLLALPVSSACAAAARSIQLTRVAATQPQTYAPHRTASHRPLKSASRAAATLCFVRSMRSGAMRCVRRYRAAPRPSDQLRSASTRCSAFNRAARGSKSRAEPQQFSPRSVLRSAPLRSVLSGVSERAPMYSTPFLQIRRAVSGCLVLPDRSQELLRLELRAALRELS